MEYIKFENFIDSTQYGYTAEATSAESGDAKYLRITDIVPYFVDKDRVPFCAIDASKISKYLVSEGDLLIARTGATTGYNLLVDDSFKNFVFASYLIRFNYNRNKIVPKFLKYVLKSPSWYGFVNNYIGGSAQPGMNAKVFGKFYLPYHSIPTQQKIASILSAYDSQIENNQKRIKLLEQMAENLYKEWFVRFRFPGYETAEFEGGVPKGWKICQIKEICEINKRTINTKKAPKSILYLDTSSITEGAITELQELDFRDAPSRARRIVKENSILYSTVRPNLKHFGILKKIPSNLIVSTGFAVLDCKADIANIVYLALASEEITSYCSMIAEGAVATYPSIKAEEIGKITLPLPPISLAIHLNGILDTIFHEIHSIHNQNDLLTTQRDLLLPRLMSGKLSI